MMAFEIQKTAFEILRRAVDFKKDSPDETLDADSISVTSINQKTGTDSSVAIIAAAPAPSIPAGTKQVRFYVKGGAHGETHKITVKVATTGGTQKFEQQVYLRVDDN